MRSRFALVHSTVRRSPSSSAHAGLEAELRAGLRGAAEAPAGVIPRAARRDLQLGLRVGEAQDRLGQLADRRLDAGREVVDVAGRAERAAAQQPLDDVVDVDEVAAGLAAVVERAAACP